MTQITSRSDARHDLPITGECSNGFKTDSAIVLCNGDQLWRGDEYLWQSTFHRAESRDKLKDMKQRFLNQKLGKRNNRRAELQKAKRLVSKSRRSFNPKPRGQSV